MTDAEIRGKLVRLSQEHPTLLISWRKPVPNSLQILIRHRTGVEVQIDLGIGKESDDERLGDAIHDALVCMAIADEEEQDCPVQNAGMKGPAN